MLNFDRRNSPARWSSNSGFDGGLVSRKSSTSCTIPLPKKCPQRRFDRALAKNGLSGRTIQSTRACRGSSSGENLGAAPSGYLGSGTLPVRGSFSPVVALAEEK